MRNTERPSAALKNFGKTNQQIGQDREEAATQYLLNIGHRVLARRFKTPFAEVDIVSVGSDQYVYIIEVKGPFREGLPIVSREQLRRLQRAALYLSHHHRAKVRLQFLLVTLAKDHPKVEVVDIFEV